MQDIVQKLRDPDVRSDFETGSNGAVKLDDAAWPWLDKLLAEGFVSLVEASSNESYSAQAHRAADHWVSTVDGKPKQFMAGCSYELLRRVVRSIQDCGYFQRRFPSTATDDQPVQKTSGSSQSNAVVSEDAEEGNTENGQGEACEGGDFKSDAPTSVNFSADAHLSMNQLSAAPSTHAEPTIDEQEGNPIPVLQTDSAHTDQVFVGAFTQTHLPGLLPTLAPTLIPAPVDPNALPEELQSGAFSFLQESELDDSQGNLTVAENGAPAHSPNSHASNPMSQAQTQAVPTAKLLLINPIVTMTQSHQLEQLVANGVAGNGIGGGVTPPMFSFPFQSSTVGNLPIPNGAALQTQQQHLNPVQQLVKSLNAANFNHHPVSNGQAASLIMHTAMNGVATNVVATANGASLAMVPGFVAGAPEGNTTNNENADPETVQTENSPAEPSRVSPTLNSTEPMTISEWDPVGKGKGKSHSHERNNIHKKRETSEESGEDRRRDDRRNGSGSRQHDNGNIGNGNGGGYNGSRRRYGGLDRSNSNGNGGGTNFNGSRMQQRNGDGENGTAYRGGSAGKSHHFNRMSNGGGAPMGSGSNNGGSGTFYRNNDPNYFHGMKSSRHGQQGYNQRHSPASGGRT